jgi:hypothetical protein
MSVNRAATCGTAAMPQVRLCTMVLVLMTAGCAPNRRAGRINMAAV